MSARRIDDSQPARMNAMALLPESTLVSLISEKSRTMDVSWLTTMQDAGLFGSDQKTQGAIPGETVTEKLDPWATRLMACTQFLGNIRSAPRNEKPIPGTTNDEFDVTSIAVLKAQDNFKEWFTGVARGMVPSLRDAVQNPECNFSSVLRDKAKKVGGEWLIAACALDLPDVAKEILQACPAANAFEIAHSRLGNWLNGNAMGLDSNGRALMSKGFLVNASYVALQLSHPECLRVLNDAVGEPSSKLVFGSETDKGHPTPTVFGLFEGKFTPVCDQKTFAVAIELAKRHPDELQHMENCAIQALRDVSWVNTSSYVPSFTEAGVYRGAGLTAAEVACKNGHVAVMQSLEGAIRWSTDDGRQGNLLSEALSCGNNGNRKNIKGALNALAKIAISEGGAAAIFTADGKVSDDLVNNAVHNQAVDLLVKIMDNTDLRPSTVIEFHNNEHARLDEYVARLPDPRVANMLRSWSARSSAHALLDELGLPASEKGTTP